jgi:3-oxoacyl-[acyl-carrier-protein] synthase II
MSAIIAGASVRTCLGNGEETFHRLLRGNGGISDLEGFDGLRLNVGRGYHVANPPPEEARFRASGWLAACVREALEQSAVDPASKRVVVLVGTGLRELREVERWSEDEVELEIERLHFAATVRDAVPDVASVITISNACSAGGHALGLAQDMIELGDADAVVAAGADAMTASMLAMIGRVSERPADQLRPFDAARGGALLGEGAAAITVTPQGRDGPRLATLLATGMSCDAFHETAPDMDGVLRAVSDAFARARRTPADVDLVVAHATGTRLNDPMESEVLRRTFEYAPTRPLVTALKGALGHTSGAAALMSVDVAIRCSRERTVPPIVGLQQRIPESDGLALVCPQAERAHVRTTQVNSFGFGGVNAVTLLEVPL